MNRNLLLIKMMMFTAVSPLGARCAGDSIIGKATHLADPVEIISRRCYTANPACMPALIPWAMSETAAGFRYDDSDEAIILQEGKGNKDWELGASSFKPLGGGSAVWGKASFRSGRTADVKWTDCIDYSRLAPYVLGDSVGGDLSEREYRFGGGYARRLSDSMWTLGIQADYRAEIAYRNRDPRLKTVVSDLRLKAGCAYALGAVYTLGFSASVNVYSQNSDLDFYNPINDINTLTFTGLGTYYPRFAGNTNKNSGYNAIAFDAGLQLVTADHSGLKCRLTFGMTKTGQQLRDFNNLTLGRTSRRNLGLLVSYRLDWGGLTAEPAMEVSAENIRGTENLFGASQGGSFPEIGSRSPYRHRLTSYRALFPVTGKAGYSLLSLTPSIGFNDNLETLSEPVRRLHASHLVPALNVIYSRPLKSQMIMTIGGEYSRTCPLKSEQRLDNLNPSSGLGKAVKHNFAMLSATTDSYGGSCSVGYVISGILFKISGAYRFTRYHALTSRRQFITTLSATF